MAIITYSSLSRVESDKLLDKIPIASTVNNLVDLAQRIIHREQSVASKDYYYRYISNKSILRCLFLCVPVIGQIGVYFHDLYNEKTINSLLSNRKYEDAANLGSGDALAALATNYELGIGVPRDKERSIDLYRKAAEKGNLVGFLNIIMDKEDSEYLTAFKDDKFGLIELIKKQSHSKTHYDIITKIHSWLIDYFTRLKDADKHAPSIANHKNEYRKIIRIGEFLHFPGIERTVFGKYTQSVKDEAKKLLTSLNLN